jgi:hypothetical protein
MTIMKVLESILLTITILLFILIDGVMVAMVLYEARMDMMMRVIYIITLIMMSMISYGLYIEPIKGGGHGHRHRHRHRRG